MTSFDACNLVKSVNNNFFEGAVGNNSGPGSVRQNRESQADFKGVGDTVAWNPESSLKIVSPEEWTEFLDSILVSKSFLILN